MKNCNCGSRFCKKTEPKVKKEDGFTCPECGEKIESVYVESKETIFYTIDLTTKTSTDSERGGENTDDAIYICRNCDEEITGYINNRL